MIWLQNAIRKVMSILPLPKDCYSPLFLKSAGCTPVETCRFRIHGRMNWPTVSFFCFIGIIGRNVRYRFTPISYIYRTSTWCACWRKPPGRLSISGWLNSLCVKPSCYCVRQLSALPRYRRDWTIPTPRSSPGFSTNMWEWLRKSTDISNIGGFYNHRLLQSNSFDTFR